MRLNNTQKAKEIKRRKEERTYIANDLTRSENERSESSCSNSTDYAQEVHEMSTYESRQKERGFICDNYFNKKQKATNTHRHTSYIALHYVTKGKESVYERVVHNISGGKIDTHLKNGL